MYTLRLYHDVYAPGSVAEDDLEAQHSIAYVLEGAAALNGQLLEADQALYYKDVTSVEAGGEGAVIWRWELVRTEEPNNLAWGDGVTSRLRMSRRIRMFELVPTSKWLFRLDCIYNNRGSTGLHSHPGSGIRCMLKGHLRVESDKGESSDNRLTGDCWYEEGVTLSSPHPIQVRAPISSAVWSYRPSMRATPIPPYGSRARNPASPIGGATSKRSSPCCERSPGRRRAQP